MSMAGCIYTIVFVRLVQFMVYQQTNVAMPAFTTFEVGSSARPVGLLVFQSSVHYSTGHHPIRVLIRECII